MPYFSQLFNNPRGGSLGKLSHPVADCLDRLRQRQSPGREFTRNSGPGPALCVNGGCYQSSLSPSSSCPKGIGAFCASSGSGTSVFLPWGFGDLSGPVVSS